MKPNVSKEISTGTSFYHAHSSSGNSSESNTSSFDERDATPLRKPQQMMQQVGGVSSHKKPVLTLEPHYILKPVRLTHLHQDRCHNDYIWAKDGSKDKTKVYRGVREIAFYEALAFASRLSHLIASYMDPEDILSSRSIGYIVSCHYTVFRSAADTYTPNEDYQSIIRMIKNVCNNADSWNWLAFLVAHYAGDEVVMSAFKSYIDTCTTLANTMESLNNMSVFTPHYYGVVDVQSIQANEHLPPDTATLSHLHLLLGNVTSNFRHPNIIDLKMGTQTFEPSAPESKQRREVQKYPKQAEFGFRVVGMRVYDKITDDYICEDKSFGVSLMTKDQVIGALRKFFCLDGAPSNAICSTQVDDILSKLNDVKDWFENSNPGIAFYAGSILIVYEGDTDTTSSIISEPPVVKMIDFAHVCRKQGGDEGYLKGINTLLAMLHEIRNEMRLQHHS